LPLAAYSQGFKVTEVPVDNRARKYGKAKFGIGKPVIGLMDTITAYFLFKFSEQPLHFFGVIGSLLFVPGFWMFLCLIFIKVFFGATLSDRPLLIISIFMMIVGIQILMTGIIGELLVYMHKKSLKATDKI
jgi:hypothetical protein